MKSYLELIKTLIQETIALFIKWTGALTLLIPGKNRILLEKEKKTDSTAYASVRKIYISIMRK